MIYLWIYVINPPYFSLSCTQWCSTWNTLTMSWNLERIKSSRTILSIWRQGWRAANHLTRDALGKRSPSCQILFLLLHWKQQYSNYCPFVDYEGKLHVYSSCNLKLYQQYRVYAGVILSTSFLHVGLPYFVCCDRTHGCSALPIHCNWQLLLKKEFFNLFRVQVWASFTSPKRCYWFRRLQGCKLP